jgi:hypothetical protein
MTATALIPLGLVVTILATDAWVYSDARAQAAHGTPVVFTYGVFRIETPPQWFFACLFLWLLFFPLYLVGRRA